MGTWSPVLTDQQKGEGAHQKKRCTEKRKGREKHPAKTGDRWGAVRIGEDHGIVGIRWDRLGPIRIGWDRPELVGIGWYRLGHALWPPRIGGDWFRFGQRQLGLVGISWRRSGPVRTGQDQWGSMDGKSEVRQKRWKNEWTDRPTDRWTDCLDAARQAV